jgi:hypothetical protein
MRNLVQYPITVEEVGVVLDTALQRALNYDGFGSTDAFVFSRLLELVENEIISADQFIAYENVKFE